MDAIWEQEARRVFAPDAERMEVTFLSALPLEELVGRVGSLPAHSIIYYIHVFKDETGRALVPANVLESLAQNANAPIYGHVDTYVGRGAVGGHMFSFARAGQEAAELGLRVLAGEDPERIGILQPSTNDYVFDGDQLSRWRIDERRLPPGSLVHFREPTFWSAYKWHVAGISAFCSVPRLFPGGIL